jgi:hypothetical protein
VSTRQGLGLILLTAIGASAAAVSGLLLTNPAQVGPAGVTIWFVTLLVAMSATLALSLFIGKFFLWPQASRRTQLSNSWRQGLLMGGTITILIALQSLRQLSSRDILLISLLVLLIEFYFRTRS